MPVQRSNFKAEIATLLAHKDLPAVKARLVDWLPADVAPILSALPIEQRALLFRGGSRELSAAVFSHLEHPAKRKLLKTLTPPPAAELLNALPPEDRTSLLIELPLDLTMQLIAMLNPVERRVTQDLLAYPVHRVGRMMTLDFVAVHPDWTVLESLNYIRAHGYDRETLNMVYGTDLDGHLVDDIRVRRFLLAEPETKVSALMDGKAIVLSRFIPRVISSGGKAGSQAATLAIRALGEFKLRDWWRIMRRELAAGSLLGLILGATGFMPIIIWSRFSHLYDPSPFLVATAAGVALIGIVLWGSLMDSMLPLVFEAARLRLRDVERVLCRDPGGRDGPDHLLNSRALHHALGTP